MDLGRCPACARSYTASEVAGYGILRSRPAIDGGPTVEFACPGCMRAITLIPHGQGRYAPPGEPPPAHVPEAARRPPWVQEGAARQAPPADKDRPGGTPSEPDPIEVPEPEWEPELPPPSPPVPLPTVSEALELLGVNAAATEDEIDRAFRERSRTCHPDKVEHLDIEFQDLAERKFRRLLAAYELLRDSTG